MSPTQIVTAFSTAADARDTDTLERLLHPDFRAVLTVGGGDALVLSRAAWFGMLRDGKIGGVPRTLRVERAEDDGPVSTVVAALDGASGRFASTFTVVRDAQGRRIIQDALVFTPA